MADSGPGLSAEAQKHVFDRFWRGNKDRNRQSGGSGLGLAICRAIILAHDGQITVSSELGQGTTFTFSLPASGTAVQ
ncbi:MAG: ATP-binding protein [Chloroflexota bacterium]